MITGFADDLAHRRGIEGLQAARAQRWLGVPGRRAGLQDGGIRTAIGFADGADRSQGSMRLANHRPR
jgi:hypothetical protein